MALKLGNRPGQVYDPEEESRRVPQNPPDDGLEEAWNQPDSESVNPSLAKDEEGVTKESGNRSATTDEEAGLGDSTADDNAPNEKESGKGRASKGSKRRNQLAIAVGGGLTLTLVGLALFLPRIMTDIIVDRLTDTFLGRSKYAVQQRMEHYAGKYVVKVIGGELRGTCGGTINRECVPSNSIAGRLYGSWRTNKMEDKLFTKYGIEFELDKFDSAKILVKQNGKPLGDFGQREVARVVTKSIEAETKFEGMVDRRHIRSVLARKYGANKFCIIACSQRDNLDETRINALRKLKLKLISRVSEVGASRTSAYLLCLTIQCSDADLKNSENQIIQEVLSKNSDEYLKELAGDIERIKPGSLTELVIQRQIENLLAKVISKEAAKSTAKAIPIAGQIYFAATAIEIVTNIDDKINDGDISKYLRDVNSQESALYATQILVMADDNNSGQASVEDSWATFQLLNGFGKSRLAQELNGVEQKSTVECADGVVLGPEDQELICPEKKIQPVLEVEKVRNDPVVDAVMTLVNPYNYCFKEVPIIGCAPPRPRDTIQQALKGVNAVFSFVGGALFSIAGTIFPPLQDFMNLVNNFVAEYATKFFTWASAKLLPRVVIPDAEDEVAYDQAAMGFDVTGNQFCRGDADIPDASNIGCAIVTAREQSELDRAIYAEKKQEMSEQSVLARYFDMDNSDSLVGNISLAVGGELTNIGPRNVSWFNLSSIVTTVLQTVGLQEKTIALSLGDQAALFGVTQYAYAVDDPALSVDGETLTPEVCAEYERIRNSPESMFTNGETGEVDYKATNPCALDEVVADSLTKIYDLDAVGETVASINAPVVGSLTGPQLPCEGQSRPITRNAFDSASWSGITPTGSIGTHINGDPINVYVRPACDQANKKTVVIAGSIHGSENGGQIVAQTLLFKTDLPSNIEVIAIPKICACAGTGLRSSNNVDLNRNFNYDWADLPQSQTFESGRTYTKGPSPESEPETKALVGFLGNLGRINLFISYHDSLNYVAPVGSTDASVASAFAAASGMHGQCPENPSNQNCPIKAVNQDGSLDAWYNQQTGSPTLLLEWFNSPSSAAVDRQVSGILAALGRVQ